MQNIARATYREILERRARKNQIDFIEGVGADIALLAVVPAVAVFALALVALLRRITAQPRSTSATPQGASS